MATSALRAHGSQHSAKIEISLATADDRPEIYRIRHQIYALELRQHNPNTAQALTDLLDEYNIYLKASVGGCLVGFVSVTPPGYRYSVDKYFERAVFPFPFDGGVYEVRLLTVLPEYRTDFWVAGDTRSADCSQGCGDQPEDGSGARGRRGRLGLVATQFSRFELGKARRIAGVARRILMQASGLSSPPAQLGNSLHPAC
jgi:hypothetical protein